MQTLHDQTPGHFEPIPQPIKIKELNKLCLTTKEASELTGIPEATLTTWRCQGRGPKYVKISNRIYYMYDSLRKFIESNEYATTDQQ